MHAVSYTVRSRSEYVLRRFIVIYFGSIALQYLPEHTIELIELDNLKDDHWAKRVTKEKIDRVTLEDAELTDFLYTTNNATFGFINVRIKTCYEVYLMILSPIASLNVRLDNY